MSQNPPPLEKDHAVMLLYVLLLLGSVLIVAVGVMQYIRSDPRDATVAAIGALAVIFTAGTYPIAQMLREGMAGSADDAATLDLLRSVNDRLLISDTAKRIAYREQDRETLRAAIREDIKKGDYEAALVLVSQMSQAYGYRREAEEFRERILTARAQEIDHQVSQMVSELDRVIDRQEWDRAMAEAGKIQRLFPDAVKARGLDKRVRDARIQHKHDLERKFLEAAQRDDVETAMELLKELDKYLTEAEAEPFLETARGVIGKKRQNLGVQFKMAVHDKEWTQAVVVGEQIIRDFPNSKMAIEVRGMLDLLRERAAGEQAARPREMA